MVPVYRVDIIAAKKGQTIRSGVQSVSGVSYGDGSGGESVSARTIARILIASVTRRRLPVSVVSAFSPFPPRPRLLTDSLLNSLLFRDWFPKPLRPEQGRESVGEDVA